LTLNPGVYVGYVSNYLWYAAMFSAHGVAGNRFFAITFPVAYARLFTTRRSCIVLVVLWTAAFLEEIWYFFGKFESPCKSFAKVIAYYERKVD
jgi:hypothetical protein